MIIVEGMDNTGKTTLVKNLAKEFKLEVRKTPQDVIMEPGRLLDWVDHELDQVEVLPSLPFLYDRFPLISEEVYGPILRGKSVVPGGSYEGWADRNHVLFIYCRPALDRIIDFGARDQMQGVVQHAKDLTLAYDKLMYSYRFKGAGVVHYSYTHFDAYQRARSAVQQYINNYRLVE